MDSRSSGTVIETVVSKERESLMQQLDRVTEENQQVFVMRTTKHGNIFRGYAKIYGHIVQHGPSFVVRQLRISSYAHFSHGIKIGGLEEAIYPDRTEYRINGWYFGRMEDTEFDMLPRALERLQAEFAPIVNWSFLLPANVQDLIIDGDNSSLYNCINF
jgi:hypothetical protein